MAVAVRVGGHQQDTAIGAFFRQRERSRASCSPVRQVTETATAARIPFPVQ